MFSGLSAVYSEGYNLGILIIFGLFLIFTIKLIISWGEGVLISIALTAILYMSLWNDNEVSKHKALKDNKITVVQSYFSEKNIALFNEEAGKVISLCLELDSSEQLQLEQGVCSVENKKIIYKNLTSAQINHIRSNKATFEDSNWSKVPDFVDAKTGLLAKQLTFIGTNEALANFKLNSSIELPNFSKEIEVKAVSILNEKFSKIDVSQQKDLSDFKKLIKRLNYICGVLSEANCKEVENSAKAVKQKGISFDYKKELELIKI